jgi:CRP-like cAMP-binding protein
MGRIDSLLGATPLFEAVPPDELAPLAARARSVKLPARGLLFSRGDPGAHLYVLASGLIRIGVVSPEGREVTYDLIRPGELFGEIAVLDGGPRSADATAMEESELISIDRRDLMAFLEQRPAHCVRLLTIVCQRVRAADALIEDLFFLAATNRLAKHLLTLSETVGDKSSGDVIIRVSQQEVADHIGISRERVNKLLTKWEQAGLVGLWRGRITLHDLDGLDGLVGAERDYS